MSQDTPWGRRVQAVGFASLQVEELENRILSLLGNAEDIGVEQVLATVIRATGTDPINPLAKAPLADIAALRDVLNQAVRLCESAKQHLNQFSGSF